MFANIFTSCLPLSRNPGLPLSEADVSLPDLMLLSMVTRTKSLQSSIESSVRILFLCATRLEAFESELRGKITSQKFLTPKHRKSLHSWSLFRVNKTAPHFSDTASFYLTLLHQRSSKEHTWPGGLAALVSWEQQWNQLWRRETRKISKCSLPGNKRNLCPAARTHFSAQEQEQEYCDLFVLSACMR